MKKGWACRKPMRCRLGRGLPSRISSGLLVHHPTLSSIALIQFYFAVRRSREGASIGDGSNCLFVMITQGHAGFHPAISSTSKHRFTILLKDESRSGPLTRFARMATAGSWTRKWQSQRGNSIPRRRVTDCHLIVCNPTMKTEIAKHYILSAYGEIAQCQ